MLLTALSGIVCGSTLSLLVVVAPGSAHADKSTQKTKKPSSSVHKSSSKTSDTSRIVLAPDTAALPPIPTAAVREGSVDRSGLVDRSGSVVRAASAPLPSRGEHITRTAQQFKGWPYVWGGTSPKSGFDCSGLVQYVYAKWGIYLPRCASDQVHKGIPVKVTELQAGDLVFFQNTYKQGLSHVGIYVGKGWFIHAASARTGVIMSRLDRGYHKEHYYGARRLNLSKLPPVPGEETQNSRIVLEEPVIGDPLPSPQDMESSTAMP